MPTRAKRGLDDHDPNKSDSDDETYGASIIKSAQSRSSKQRTTKPSRKRQKRGYDGGDSSDEDDDDDETSESDISASDSEVSDDAVIGPSGRPQRRAVKNTRPIIDDDSEDIEATGNGEDDDEDDTSVARSGKLRPGPSHIIILRYGPGRDPTSAPISARKSGRRRSGSISGSRPASAGLSPSSTRRGSRRTHGNADLVALTTSGHHEQNVEHDRTSPTGPSKRPTRGGKGIMRQIAAQESGDEENADDNEPSLSKDRSSLDELQDEHNPGETTSGAGKDAKTTSEHDSDDEDGPQSAGENVTIIPESGDEDEQGPVRSSRRASRVQVSAESRGQPPTILGKRKARGSQRGVDKESSDFEPPAEEAEEEDVSDSEHSASPRKPGAEDADYDSSPIRRAPKRRRANTRSRRVSDDSEEQEELLEELDDLHPRRGRRAKNLGILMESTNRHQRRQVNKVNYDIAASNAAIQRAIEAAEEPDESTQNTPSKKGRGGAGGLYGRSLFSTYGPFGGAGAPSVLGPSAGLGAVGGADSDSSDDEAMQRPKTGTVGGTIGMTPTTAHPLAAGLPAIAAQPHGSDGLQANTGTPANLGRVKDKQALADADPLGVDQNVNFDGVGGLAGHIDQLKEMVALPLLYPEIFQRFHVVPPRGVLFHGPPGTGKTLLARALASSISSEGRKVTFYMRKGADALSKWVGEAERQLRLLFEEARKTQPSIIFFDEIDGLAPVRSSKQEQIHASIVSTLLALMDGMDGRGQVIVIGATNRPDSVDPALRRPGRFDREFYFPLPNTDSRRAILDIHTKDWDPPLTSVFKDEVARATKGYGGADLRALCTEAALNAVQRRYPQIYKSSEKLLINPETISVSAKDFMLSVKKMVPSSERSASSGAAPLPAHVEPLLKDTLHEIEALIAQILPQKKPLTALQEAEFEDAEDDHGMKAERLLQEFERSRVFRPRLLLKGAPGMGQQYLAGALLNHFETLHVQSFDLPTLLSDATRSPEAAIVQLFTEAKRHKPSVIYIPNVDIWYQTVGGAAISTFTGLLRTLAPTDPIMLLGVLETQGEVDGRLQKDLFGFSKKSLYTVQYPLLEARRNFFNAIIDYIRTAPDEFPTPTERKKRALEILMPAPPEAPKALPEPSKEELRAQKKKDRLHLNQLKIAIQPVMDHIKLKYRKFRLGVIDEKEIRYLFEEDDPDLVTSDLPHEQRLQGYRPFEKAHDEHGEPGLVSTATGKFFYNLDVATIEKRLSNGYYKRAKDFLSDVKKLTKDAKMSGDEERLLKANELQANVEVDMSMFEAQYPALALELEQVHSRELERQRNFVAKAKAMAAEQGQRLKAIQSNVHHEDPVASSTDRSTGPINLGQTVTTGLVEHPVTPSNPSTQTNGVASRISDLSNLHGHNGSTSTSHPSFGEAELGMSNSDSKNSAERDTQAMSSFGPSAQTRPPESYTGGVPSLQQRKSIPNSLTQDDAVTPMAVGSQAADYTNYASTTSSDKRYTGSSEQHTGSSGRRTSPSVHKENIQVAKPGPDLSTFTAGAESNSQLPDTAANTQGSQFSGKTGSNPSNNSSSQSQDSRPLSQNPAVPPFPRDLPKTDIKTLLNDGPGPLQVHKKKAANPDHVVDEDYNEDLLLLLTHQTGKMTIEQLEQIYSAMMNEIWKTRGCWDRYDVARQVKEIFEEELREIQEIQRLEADLDDER